MSRINKKKMWMGNPVLRQPSFSFIAGQTPAEISVSGASFVSYTKSGKTMSQEMSTEVNVANDEGTPVYVYGDVSEITGGSYRIKSIILKNMMSLVNVYLDDVILESIVLDNVPALNILSVNSNSFEEITIPKGNHLVTIDFADGFLKALDASNLNPATIDRIDVSGNAFLSDETEALSFANSLPTVTTSPTLTMYSSDTQATAVQSIAQSKGWKVTIS